MSTDYLLGRSSVQSADTDVKMICEYTGLSERAATNLHLINEVDKNAVKTRKYSFLDTVNLAIEMEPNINLMVTVSQFLSLPRLIDQKKYYISENGEIKEIPKDKQVFLSSNNNDFLALFNAEYIENVLLLQLQNDLRKMKQSITDSSIQGGETDGNGN